MLAQATAVYAMMAAVVGGAITGGVALWNGRREDRTEQRNTSGSVSTSDSAVVFANQIAAFEASEKLRHDTAALLAAQIEQCHEEIQALKKEMREHDEAARARIERLEQKLMEMTEQLRKGQA